MERRWEDGGEKAISGGAACNACAAHTVFASICVWEVKCKWCARFPQPIVAFPCPDTFLPLFWIYLASMNTSLDKEKLNKKQMFGYFFHSRQFTTFAS